MQLQSLPNSIDIFVGTTNNLHIARFWIVPPLAV